MSPLAEGLLADRPPAALAALDAQEKQDILEHFHTWSGGLAPYECSHQEISTYLNVFLEVGFDPEEVTDWFIAENWI